MPFEQPHQDQNELKVPANQQEKGPETVDPAAMAKERIAKAERVASIDRRQLNDISRLEQAIDSKPRKEMSEKQILDKTRLDTLSIISDRISRMQATLHTDKEAMKQTTWGQRFDSTFKLGGLLGQTSRGAEAEGIRLQDEALTKMKALHATVLEIQDLKTLKETRIQLGLAELPQDLVGDYDQYEAMRLKGAAKKDKSLEVDWLAINEQLKTAEAALDRWETAIQIADTGMGIAAGLVPGGSEVYEIAHALTDVAVGTKTPDQAARDFAFGVLASRVGGKALKKMNVDEIAGTWAKKNAKYFSKKTAESLSKVAGKTAAGATQGAISGATEGTMHGTYNVATGKATVEQALSDTASRATIGAVFGGVMGGGMEGMKIRGEFKTARQKAELKNNIMRLPDADRPQAAEIVLGHPLTDVQKKAVIAAHDVPMKDGQKYSQGELMQKMRILEASGISRTDADQLLRMGVCGAPPPPPPPKKAPQNIIGPKPPPPPPIPKPKIAPASQPTIGPKPPPPPPVPKLRTTPISQPTVGPKPPPPPPVPGIKKAPLAPPAAPMAKNVVTQKAIPADADTNQPSTKNRVAARPILKRAPRETSQDTKFLKEYGHLTEEQLALDPQLENTLDEMKKRGLFSTQFYYEGIYQEHMDVSRSSKKLNLHTMHLSDLRNNINAGPSNGRANDYQQQADTLEKIGIHELLIFKPIRASVRNGTKKEIRINEEPGLLWGKKITKQEIERPVFEEREVRFSEVVPSSTNNEPSVSLTYFVLGSQSYKTNQLNNMTQQAPFRHEHGNDSPATRDPSFKPTLAHDKMQNGILQYRDQAAANITGRPGNQISISLTLPKSEAEKLQKYFQAHPEEIRPFFLRGGQEYMLTHMPPPFAKWDEQPRPVRFRTFDAQAKTFKDEDVKRPGN